MFQPNQPFPFRCKDYKDYLKVVETIDRLNSINPVMPIKYVLVSGSSDPDYPGARYLDLNCLSPGKIAHLFEEIQKSDQFLKDQALEKKSPPPKNKNLKSLFGPGEYPFFDKNALHGLDNLPIQGISLYKINPKTGIPEKTDTKAFLKELEEHLDKDVYKYYLDNFGNPTDFED